MITEHELNIEILELRLLKKRFQNTCSHGYSTIYTDKSRSVCSNCGWDLNICQHKKSIRENHKYCAECGLNLKLKRVDGGE